jgi:hypothetical protein
MNYELYPDLTQLVFRRGAVYSVFSVKISVRSVVKYASRVDENISQCHR